MKTLLAYGESPLTLEVGDTWVVMEPKFSPGIKYQDIEITETLREHSPPLEGGDTVCVVIPDMTRPAPTEMIVKNLLREIAHVEVCFLVGTGSHRPATESELESMLGKDIARRYRVVNHDAFNKKDLGLIGHTRSGIPVWLNRQYLEADKRISIGLIEPHFFAGFSGGPKAIVPGIAGIETILGIHSASLIDHPGATWGSLDHNPVHKEILEACNLLPPDLSLNVTINKNREITGVFAGDVVQAHRQGCALTKRLAMTPVTRFFDIVVTTNGGWPLDQNLYQTVKGLSAASQILKTGGCIVCASECLYGLPSDGNFAALLRAAESPGHLLDTVRTPGFTEVDQWEAQALCNILRKATVFLFSALDPEEAKVAFLQPVNTVEEGLSRALRMQGSDAKVAVLPQGPFTIPYVQDESLG